MLMQRPLSRASVNQAQRTKVVESPNTSTCALAGRPGWGRRSPTAIPGSGGPQRGSGGMRLRGAHISTVTTFSGEVRLSG